MSIKFCTTNSVLVRTYSDLTNEGHCHSGWPLLPCSTSTGYLPPFIIPGWPGVKQNPEGLVRRVSSLRLSLTPSTLGTRQWNYFCESVMCDLWLLAGTSSGRLSFPRLAWLERHCLIEQWTRAGAGESRTQFSLFTKKKRKIKTNKQTKKPLVIHMLK